MASTNEGKPVKTRLEQLLDAKNRADTAKNKAVQRAKKISDELKAQLDKERTHRLCERGGHLESHLVEAELLTDEEVFRLIDYIFSFNSIRQIVADLIAIHHGEKIGTVDEVFAEARNRQNQHFQNRASQSHEG